MLRFSKGAHRVHNVVIQLERRDEGFRVKGILHIEIVCFLESLKLGIFLHTGKHFTESFALFENALTVKIERRNILLHRNIERNRNIRKDFTASLIVRTCLIESFKKFTFFH